MKKESKTKVLKLPPNDTQVGREQIEVVPEFEDVCRVEINVTYHEKSNSGTYVRSWDTIQTKILHVIDIVRHSQLLITHLLH